MQLIASQGKLYSLASKRAPEVNCSLTSLMYLSLGSDLVCSKQEQMHFSVADRI